MDRVHALVERTKNQTPNIRYNKAMLSFLLQQVEKLSGVADLPKNVPKSDLNKLEKDLGLAERLIRHHACPFDLIDFYVVDEVKFHVNRLCERLRNSVLKCKLHATVDIMKGVPDDYIEKDRHFLQRCLSFLLLKGVDCELDIQHKKEWWTAKNQVATQMRTVEFSEENEIDLKDAEVIGRGGESVVYKAQWRQQMRAVKQLHRPDSSSKIETFALLCREAAINASVSGLSEHLTTVLAVAKPNLLVMELATQDLISWYVQNKNLSWGTKIQILHQAASGLACLHGCDRPVVHHDVKTANFMVFENGPDEYPTIKLCDLGTAAAQADCVQTTLRQQARTLLYCAPELDIGKPHTCESDVFSFGIVMSEIAAQQAPYEGADSDMEVRSKKNAGELPCEVPDDTLESLTELMLQRLSTEPCKRTSMKVIQQTLEEILEKEC